MANRWGNNGTVTDFIFLGFKITADGDCSHEIKRRLRLGRKAMTNLDSLLKSRAITLPTKVHPVKAMVFPVVMYGCESWTINKAECWRTDAFCTVVLKTLESPLDGKKIQPVHRKGNQSWIFIGRIDAKVETPIFWPPDGENWLLGKDHYAGEEKGMTEDGMVGCHHWLNQMNLSRLWELVMDRVPCMLQSMVWQRVGHEWATELNWIKINISRDKDLID